VTSRSAPVEKPISLPPGIAIRRAKDGELRACRMLVPEAFLPRRAPECFVALPSSPTVPVAAAAVSWSAGGFPVQVHVIPPWRRRGVGRALVEAVAAEVAGETDRLRSWGMIPEGSPAHAFMTATSFTVARRFVGFETDGRQFADAIVPLRQRLERKGRIPADLRIVSLRDAPHEQVTRLAATELSIAPSALAARLAPQDMSGVSNDLSVVLMLHGAVCGAILVARDGDMARVDVNVVAPEQRQGWANVILLEEAVRRGLAGGIKWFRFFSDEKTRDTMNLGKRAAATQIGTGLVLERRLERPEPVQVSASQS
jgi:GNAT superfamily N-acetyltransferase